MKKVVDAHVHLGYFSMPNHCYDFVKRIGFTRVDIHPSELTLRDEEIEIEKILLIPSFPCGNNLCTDGFYDQVKWRKGFEDTFLLVATVNPNCNMDIKKELENQYSLGAVAIKLHPVHHYYKPNDYRPEEKGLKNLIEIYSFAEDYKLPIIFHTGTSIATNARNKFGDPIFIDDVVRDFNVNVILAHAGRPIWCNTAFYMAKNYSNVYIEISSIPVHRIREYIPRINEILDKVIYGSDFPHYNGQTLIQNAKDIGNFFKWDNRVMRENIIKLIRIH
ncbi:MAG: amidohydrolase family protein [Sulfolobaceae archaeon]